MQGETTCFEANLGRHRLSVAVQSPDVADFAPVFPHGAALLPKKANHIVAPSNLLRKAHSLSMRLPVTPRMLWSAGLRRARGLTVSKLKKCLCSIRYALRCIDVK